MVQAKLSFNGGPEHGFYYFRRENLTVLLPRSSMALLPATILSSKDVKGPSFTVQAWGTGNGGYNHIRTDTVSSSVRPLRSRPPIPIPLMRRRMCREMWFSTGPRESPPTPIMCTSERRRSALDKSVGYVAERYRWGRSRPGLNISSIRFTNSTRCGSGIRIRHLSPSIGYGFKDVTIEYSVDGIDYTTLGTTHEFAGRPALPDNEHETTVDFGNVTAKYVRLTANSNWGGIVTQYGLSEVRFFHIPVNAREPSPDSGATDVDVNVTLGWRAGEKPPRTMCT